MRRVALHGSLRRWLARLHRWSGLTIMACLLVAGATGTWPVFRVEIDRWLNPRTLIVRAGDTALSTDDLVVRVQERLPGAMISGVRFPDRPERRWRSTS